MESVYAVLILHKAQKKITEAAIEKVLKAAGASVDKAQITKLVAGLKEVSIEDLIKSAAAAPVMSATPIASQGKAEKKKAAKKEEAEEADEEPTGLGSLF